MLRERMVHRRGVLAKGLAVLTGVGAWLLPVRFGPSTSAQYSCPGHSTACGFNGGAGCFFNDCAYNCMDYGCCRLEQYIHCSEWCFNAATNQWYLVDCSYILQLYGCNSCNICPRFITYC